jgi:hypothetical protein
VRVVDERTIAFPSYNGNEPSRFVPRAERETPVADWKRVDALQDVLPEGDKRRVERGGGVLSAEEYVRGQREEG